MFGEKTDIIIKDYLKFVTFSCGQSIKDQPNSKDKTFDRLRNLTYDLLISAKLKFFEMLSHKVKKILGDLSSQTIWMILCRIFLI